ncbi:beta-N-acetylhexosaminidase [Emticicia aquatilis]|uniref:beta-N-acetylhexosaminidase n=1 Tax=Emticicia aquatilis TaxID=1537369 RepID=A0A917DW39_9BACT|nr:family 20 glycosylhydrolase [Emticicia aquatilis]GGD73036.1 beta-N-acetylhexosaminidase [Emticicia aquatilis]
MLKRTLLVGILCIYNCLGFAQQTQKTLAIIPKPVSITYETGSFIFDKQTTILAEKSLEANAKFLQTALQHIHHFSFAITNKSKQAIELRIDSVKVRNREGYFLTVSSSQISIIGHDVAGVFYGVQSLIQLSVQSKSIPACRIEDYPRFAYRGLHLDVGRNMFPISFLKKYIDLLASYKLNTFHWHLTDDQGWRIEIKKYPRLQTVAAYRQETIIGHKKDSPHRFDGKPYGGFYTQLEVKELVRYATQRHVTIIPEIEMPGHASAALAAYPEFGCRQEGYQTATFWGVFDEVFCAGNDKTFSFLQDVLDEVLPLFSSKYIHIGGDECPKVRWKACPKCQQRIKTQGLADEHELQSYFIQRIEKYLNGKGREIIGWDEILEGGLSPNATVMSWRGEAGGIAAAQQKHEVIMTPESHLYLDYYQSLHSDEPTAAAGYTSLTKVYSYEPHTKDLQEAYYPFIKGVQANVWTEYMPSSEQVEYMTFPRALALAEIAWTPKELKDYDDFLSRLRQNRLFLQHKNVNYFNRFEELNYVFLMEKSGKSIIHLASTLPNAKIHYTLNRKNPTPQDSIFKDHIAIEKSTILKAQLFVENKPYGKILEQNFTYHKAIAKNITLKNQPKANYNPSIQFALGNGLAGNSRYNNGQWVGFSGEDLEAIIDLESTQSVSQIGLNLLKYHWQRMWEPNVLTFSLSTDGVNYQEVYSTSEFSVNGINKINAIIKPTQARFIKVFAKNKGIIPAGEYGAGGKAWLLVDEIIVN